MSEHSVLWQQQGAVQEMSDETSQVEEPVRRLRNFSVNTFSRSLFRDNALLK